MFCFDVQVDLNVWQNGCSTSIQNMITLELARYISSYIMIQNKKMKTYICEMIWEANNLAKHLKSHGSKLNVVNQFTLQFVRIR